MKLEPLSSQHTASLLRLANHPDIAKTSGVPSPCDEQQVKLWVEVSLQPQGIEKHFAIVLEGQIVGCCILKKIDWLSGSAELSYWLGVDYWGRGIASRAAALLAQLAFEQLGFEQLHSHYLERSNTSSGKILAKLGFEADTRFADVPVGGRFAPLAPDVWTFVRLTKQRWLAAAEHFA